MKPPAVAIKLYHRSMLDMSARARGGIFMHTPLWLLVGWVGGIGQSHPRLYGAIALLFAAILALRVTFERRVADRAAEHGPSRALFFAFILSSPAMWGAICAGMLGWPGAAGAHQMLSLVLVGLASSGSIVYAINAQVRTAYSLMAMLPPVLMGTWLGDPLTPFFLIGGAILHLYLMHAARVIHADYWAAACSRDELEERARELERLSLTDTLTQAASRQHFDRQLQLEWQRAAREKRPLSVLMIDADHFKRINDRHGHLVGDECLKRIASTMRENLRDAGDLLARFGGEEFVVLLPGADASAALASAERLRERVAELAVPVPDADERLSCSVGAHTLWPHRLGQPGDLLKGADQALYLAKALGRNRVAVAPAPAAAAVPAAAAYVEP